MDVHTLPVTNSTNDIQENFMQQLNRRVNIKDLINIQIIIFKPIGRPREEFDNVIQEFIKRGGRLDGDIIFITAMTFGQCQFEAPCNFKFVLQTSVYLTDEFKIEQRSDAAMDEIADFLINKYGIQRYLPKIHGHEVVSRKISTGDESKVSDKEKMRRYTNDTSRNIADLNMKLDDLMTNIGDLREEKRELERNVDDLKREIHEHREEIRELERNVEEYRLKINVLQQEDIRSNRIGFDGAYQNKLIRFEFQSKTKRGVGQKEKIYSVSLSAVEDEMKNIPNKNYHFQRKWEKKFHLQPGVLFDLLEFIRRELQNTPEDVLIIEGERFVSLVDGVNGKFYLPEDRFRKLLKTISERHMKGKRNQEEEWALYR